MRTVRAAPEGDDVAPLERQNAIRGPQRRLTVENEQPLLLGILEVIRRRLFPGVQLEDRRTHSFRAQSFPKRSKTRDVTVPVETLLPLIVEDVDHHTHEPTFAVA